MRIVELSLAGLRNLPPQKIVLGAQGNWLFGANGAGKTSFLEAIYLLSTGRSFRAASFEAAIAYGEAVALVSAEISHGGRSQRMGVERTRGGSVRARVDGQSLLNATGLARLLPCHLLDATTIEVVVGAPATRRQFLDWGVFHVEPSFAAASRAFRGALSQRNAVLLRGSDVELDFWDEQLTRTADLVHQARARYVTGLAAHFTEALAQLNGPEMQAVYRAGWNTTRSLPEVLEQARAAERRVARTLYGPHRADIKLTIGGRAPAQALSRGQQKIAAYALVIAQIRFERTTEARDPVVLVDDLLAELDRAHAARVNDALDGLGVQYIVTAVEPKPANEGTAGRLCLFHVERGRVSAMPTDSGEVVSD